MANHKLLQAFVSVCIVSCLLQVLASTPVIELDTFSFYPTIASGDHITFVAFVSRDCRLCKRLAETWDALADQLTDYPDVVIARFECEKGEAICTKFNVQYTPTLKLFHAGKEVVWYRAEVYHEDLLRPFLDKMRVKLLHADQSGVSDDRLEHAAQL